MMAKYDLPEWVKIYKEKGKTIKINKGNYYLYEQKCVYDKTKKHKNKKIETYLGRITEDNGFIPAKAAKIIKPENTCTKNYGSFLLFQTIGKDIYNRLEKYFGEYASLIYTIASLRAEERTMYSEIEDAYRENYISNFFKNLSVSKSSLSSFLDELSKYKNEKILFMREDIQKDDILIFDGTNILCGSQNISYAGYGYKHGHNYKMQANELYVYSYSQRKPVYYKLLEGSVSDKATLADVLKEAGIQNSISLIDNGFESDSNINSLLASKSKYIMALKRSSKLVPEEVLKDTTREKAKEIFNNEHEAIFAYESKTEKEERICIYFNQTIASVDMTEYIDKMNRKIKGYTKENLIKDQERFGIYVIKTNVTNFNLQEIYEHYKSRYEIEYMFDTVKNTLNFDKSYTKNDSSLESWAFINHISILLTQRVYDLLKEKDVNISLHHLYKKLRQVKVQKDLLDISEKFELQHIPKNIRELLKKLGLSTETIL